MERGDRAGLRRRVEFPDGRRGATQHDSHRLVRAVC